MLPALGHTHHWPRGYPADTCTHFHECGYLWVWVQVGLWWPGFCPGYSLDATGAYYIAREKYWRTYGNLSTRLSKYCGCIVLLNQVIFLWCWDGRQAALHPWWGVSRARQCRPLISIWGVIFWIYVGGSGLLRSDWGTLGTYFPSKCECPRVFDECFKHDYAFECAQ